MHGLTVKKIRLYTVPIPEVRHNCMALYDMFLPFNMHCKNLISIIKKIPQFEKEILIGKY